MSAPAKKTTTAVKPKTAPKKAVATIASFPTATPDQMLAMAVQQGFDFEKLTKIMDLRDRWEASEARKAFVSAMNQFKSDPPVILKNSTVEYENKDGAVTSYAHASLDNACVVIGKALSDVGISFRWSTNQEGGLISVTCILTHCLGHGEETTLLSTPDASGGKNSIQAVGSTVTYLQRYTLFSATGLAAQDQDTDGISPSTESNETDFYPQESFDASFPAWKEKIASGVNTAEKTINFLTQKKGLKLSPSQLEAINQVGK